MLRFLTAGSVDDGKSTLIGRLLHDAGLLLDDQLAAVREHSRTRGVDLDLSLFTDGLKAEREQGITIDVAYRYFATARQSFVIADAPGHEQYTRNMVTAASNCDLAIVLVDAGRGVLPQTRRHSFLASLLGIQHLVVAVNKMDAVGYDEPTFLRLCEDYAAFAARLEIRDVRFIPLSALYGDNVVHPSAHMTWYRGETLLHYLETVHLASDRNLIDLRFPVQYVIRAQSGFRGLAGTIASGIMRRGDEVVILPSGRRSRIRALFVGDREIDEAFAGMAVAATLESDVDAGRGDLVAHPGNVPKLADEFDTMLVWFDGEPCQPGQELLIKHTTQQVPAAVDQVRYGVDITTMRKARVDALEMNGVARCTITAARPLAIDPYRTNRQTGAFILIDRLSNRTVAAGVIVDRRAQEIEIEDAATIGAAAVLERATW